MIGRWTVKATHKGPLLGRVATGRAVTMDEIGCTRVRNGRAVDGWYYGDELMGLNTLGVVNLAPGHHRSDTKETAMTASPHQPEARPGGRGPSHTLLTRVERALARTSRGWALATVVAMFIVALYLISYAPRVPFSAKYIEDLSGGHDVLDLKFAYSPAEGAAALTALGTDGRQHYNYFQIADLVFPATYAVGLASLILALFRRWRVAAALALVPLITAAFDYVENIGVFISLRTYPHPSHQALALASGAGAVKLIGSYVAQALVVIGILLQASLMVRRRRGRRQA